MPKGAAKLVREKLERVAADPYAQHNNVTKLQNRTGFRLRVGAWRVIYELQNDQLIILVLKIGSRGEIYR
jgi:mRNA interferase RelE/StbE